MCGFLINIKEEIQEEQKNPTASISVFSNQNF